ncbi:putative glycerophosphodiester phosphodiesterase 1 [Thalassocella blandensis]|nr:putative glycerophosphodiester phosphodiesterase 1 [Thalassocella blandensis]
MRSLHKLLFTVTLCCSASLNCALAFNNSAENASHDNAKHLEKGAFSWFKTNVQMDPRPFYLVNDMDESALKNRLLACANGPFYKTDFSIGHRGAAAQFPEHTKESYQAAARMGAGILECDVTFTQDRELVCRHSQCDLHTTTNILATELASKCSVPFTPADSVSGTPAQARCCTSDITLAEFKTLCGKMDAANPNATTVAEYLNGTANWRTDWYAQCGTVLSHKESIELFQQLGVKFTPELKAPSVAMPYEGDYTQAQYAQQMIDEYKQARVSPRKVYAQSFNLADVQYWIENEPRFGRQAVFLDDRYDDPTFDPELPATWQPSMAALVADGVEIIAPPIWVLLKVSENNTIVPSTYAQHARAAGLDIITWSLERDGPLANGGGWYHQSITELMNNDGDTMNVVHALAKDVGVIGIFSDWPSTVTYYANCMKKF